MNKHLKKYFVQQHGQSDCGPACLASIVKFHGGGYNLDEIRRITGTTQTGTKLLGLYQGAKSLGFEVAGLQAESIDNLKELSEPSIIHVVLESRLQHYVVFHGFEKEQLIIGDPGKGVELWTREQLESVWQTKSLLKLSPNAQFKKAATTSRRYEKLLQWVKEDLNILGASLFLGLLIAIFSLATAVFSQKLIDVILPAKEIDKLVIGLSLFALILLIRVGLGYVRSTFLITQSKDFNNRMISSFFESLLQIPKPFFDSKKTGEMIARMNDTRRIQSTVSNLIGNLLIEVLVIITSLVGVFIYSWQIGIVVAIFIPIYSLILWKFNKPIVNSQKEVMSSYALNESNYIDVISGVSEVKSTNSAPLFQKITTLLYAAFQYSIFRLGKIQIKFNVLTDLAGILLLVAVISFASYFVLQGLLLIGSMMALLSLSGTIGPSLTKISLFNIQFQEARVAFDRMQEFSGIDGEAADGINIVKVDHVLIESLSFHYPGSLDLLKDVSIQIKKGEITTLLGESGSGKSTLLQLLQKFYKPTKGEILFDDLLLKNISLNSLRQRVAVMPQDIKIFNSYLLFNIALSEDPKDLENVKVWCKQTGFDRFFEKLPQAYMTLLGEEGTNISGGQKQLVGLARALYKNPQILLIDEGTSAMDRETEQFVLKVLRDISKEKIVFIITHRMKVASLSDAIYILKEGTIEDYGSPRELIERDNFYSRGINEFVNSSSLGKNKPRC